MQAAPDQAHKWNSSSFLSILVMKFVVLQSNDVIDLTKQGRPAPAPAQASQVICSQRPGSGKYTFGADGDCQVSHLLLNALNIAYHQHLD